MPSGSMPRDSLASPFVGYPAYGAVHEVKPNQMLKAFLYEFSCISDQVFDKTSLIEEAEIPGYVSAGDFSDEPVIGNQPEEVDYDSRRFYRSFDVETLGVSVLEMDPSARVARAIGALWEKQDFGAVEKEAKNEISRALPMIRPRLFFNRVEGVGRRLPGAAKTDIRQKLALMPDTNKFAETNDLIEDEADFIIQAITRRMKQFIYPWDITPHLTFAVFKNMADPEQIKEIKEESNAYLREHPFGVALGQLSFRHKAERRQRR